MGENKGKHFVQLNHGKIMDHGKKLDGKHGLSTALGIWTWSTQIPCKTMKRVEVGMCGVHNRVIET